jgi:hypothetical protein
MAAFPVMTYWAVKRGWGRGDRYVAVSLPYVEAIAGEPHYRPPAAQERRESDERRGARVPKAAA